VSGKSFKPKSMPFSKNKLLLLKIASFFSVIRGYNIPVIVLAQYLSAIFILSPDSGALSILLDFNLFILVLASSLTIASGYIINSFYDSKKDLINRPTKTKIDTLVSQSTKLQVYFGLNFFIAMIAYFVSWRAVLFFSVYIFLIWFYSHKIKKYAVVGNLMSAILSVLPFFGILLYYKNFYEVVFFHAIFLIKDLENIKGDLPNNYHTIPIVYGEEKSKMIITVLLFLAIVPVYFLINVFDVGYMDIYFYGCFMVFIFIGIKIWQSESKSQYLLLHNLVKMIIVGGVFCIVLINPAVIWQGEKIFMYLFQ
jgi:4-hydroxybenzoate polyprenyltransferase